MSKEAARDLEVLRQYAETPCRHCGTPRGEGRHHAECLCQGCEECSEYIPEILRHGMVEP